MLTLPTHIPLARRNTPLQLLPRLSEQFGPRIWVKRDDLTGCGLTGNKVRKLEFIVAHALSKGCDTLITCGGVQSNHCRATALVGAQLGLRVHLILRGEPGELDGNLLLDVLAGAEVSCYPEKEYQADLPRLFEHWQQHYRERGHNPWSIPTGGSDAIGLWGYISCAQELAQDFRQQQISPAAIICASGSGGTQAGLTIGIADSVGLKTPVIGMAVSDDSNYFQTKIQQDIAAWRNFYSVEQCHWLEKLNVCVNDNYKGPGYGIATKPVFDAIAQAAQQEGLLLDPVYTGKAFHGMLCEIEQGRYGAGDDLVFIHTGGIFGLFPQRESLQAGRLQRPAQ